MTRHALPLLGIASRLLTAYSLWRLWQSVEALRAAQEAAPSAPARRTTRATRRSLPPPITVDRSEQQRLEILRRQTQPRNANPLGDEDDDDILVVPE